jgi:hypothetical protein
MPVPDKAPDLRRDIDALFDHLIKNNAHDIDTPLEWHFTLRSPKLAALERLAETLEDEFRVDLQESVETTEGGRTFDGPPALSIVVVDALRADKVKSLSDRFEKLAKANKLDYEGVSSFEASEDDEDDDDAGWLSLEDATRRLRQFADFGVEETDELSLVFAIVADDQRHAEAIAKALKAAGVQNAEVMDDEGEFGVVASILGNHSEPALAKAFAKVERVANDTKANFLGVQFDGTEDDEPGDDDDDDE